MPPVQSSSAAAGKIGISNQENPDTISLDFKDAEIGTVLRVLSMKSGVNIVAGPDVKGSVTVRLDNVSWERALEVILRTYDYVFERDGNIIRVTTREKMKLEPVQTKTFILNYSKADEIQKAIQDILTERGRIKVAARTNMLVVTDIPANLYKIGEVIDKLDKVTPQAYIDAKVVKTDLRNADNLGIKWNVAGTLSGAARPTTFPFSAVRDQGSLFPIKEFFPIQDPAGTPVNPAFSVNASDPRSFPNINQGAGFTYGTLDFKNFSAILNMLESRSNTKVVSNPRITVLNNQKAKVQVGDRIPVPKYERNEQTGSMEIAGFDYQDTGVVLNVTPHINSAEEILVELTPEVTSRNGSENFGTGQITAPIFNTTRAETQVLIQSGQTIAIGGLLADSFGSAEDKVPYLGDIPLVGKLFRSKRQDLASNSKAETLFFVTVTMVDSEGQPTREKVADQDQVAGAQNVAQAMDKSVADFEQAAKSEAPNEDGTQSREP